MLPVSRSTPGSPGRIPPGGGRERAECVCAARGGCRRGPALGGGKGQGLSSWVEGMCGGAVLRRGTVLLEKGWGVGDARSVPSGCPSVILHLSGPQNLRTHFLLWQGGLREGLWVRGGPEEERGGCQCESAAPAHPCQACTGALSEVALRASPLPFALGVHFVCWGWHFHLMTHVSCLESQVSGLRSQVSGLRSQVSGLRSQVSGLRSHVSSLMVGGGLRES